MRGPSIHTKNVAFKASPELVAAAERLAAERRMSLAEFLREAVRKAVQPPAETKIVHTYAGSIDRDLKALMSGNAAAIARAARRSDRSGGRPSIADLRRMSPAELETFEASPAGQETLAALRAGGAEAAEIASAAIGQLAASMAAFSDSLATLRFDLPPMPAAPAAADA